MEEPTGRSWEDRLFDLRIEDHPRPVEEMKRLVRLQRAYHHMNAGDHALEESDFETASREYGAAEQLARFHLSWLDLRSLDHGLDKDGVRYPLVVDADNRGEHVRAELRGTVDGIPASDLSHPDVPLPSAEVRFVRHEVAVRRERRKELNA